MTPPENGITEALARERTSVIQGLRYEVAVVIPECRCEPVQGRVTLRFTLRSPHRVILDFAHPVERLRSVRAGGADLSYTVQHGHVVLPAEVTRAGENAIALEFVAGDEVLNRTDDALYSLFVPARAHLAFPCFDQPSLKARYTLSLEVPAGWQAVANGPVESAETAAGRTRVRFTETKPLPTYLFSFAAGKFSVETGMRAGREFRMFHRETDAGRLAHNREAMFDLHASALAWLEDYTGMSYPWDKFDFVMIPGFQFAGMEHPGAILYSSTLFLDETATQLQRLRRALTIAHETAHMWFGDLVTMEWFDDVWMKEVFANFLASKIVHPSFADVDHDTSFLFTHYPPAYEIDRTAGANPIRQPLANLNQAAELYGDIIYHKAPIVMRQLEMLLGPVELRDGVREYLRTFAFGTATWPDLIRILDARTTQDLSAWSRAWVEERGRPAIVTGLRTNGREISALTLEASDPWQRALVWPQQVIVTLGDEHSVEHVPITLSGQSVSVDTAIGRRRPQYVLPSGSGLGYGLFLLDPDSQGYLLDHLEDIPDPLTRGSAWVTLWDNLREARVTARAFVELVVRALPRESNEQNRQFVLSCLVRAYWGHLSPAERMERAPTLEAMLRTGMSRVTTSTEKSSFFNTFRDVVSTSEGLAWLERIWRRVESVPGLFLADNDEISVALGLALREVPGWRQMLQAQLERTGDPDRKARLAFVMPALSADSVEREQAFERFRHVENRRPEPWVIESLSYLNHPLREAHARRFVLPSLELLDEIQRTGDIFLPQRWIAAALGEHRSREVAVVVSDFLASESRCSPRLRQAIRAAADQLLRSQSP